MTTGEKILLLRKRAGLSQDKLADRLGVTRQAVSNWELDEKLPDMENAVKIANIFCVSLEYMLTEKTEQPKETKTAFVNKYDSLDFLAALGAAALSAAVMPYWIVRLLRTFWEYFKVHYVPYWQELVVGQNLPTLLDLFNASLDELAVILVLSLVIYISLKIAKNLNKNSK